MVDAGLKNNKSFIIYGMHYYDNSLLRKYQQLKNLGAEVVYVYGGGMFEWLMLQDIYGNEQFPTTTRELDKVRLATPNAFGGPLSIVLVYLNF